MQDMKYIPLFAALALAGCGGGDKTAALENNESNECEDAFESIEPCKFPAMLEAVAVAIFDGGTLDKDPYGGFAGCGLTGSFWDGTKKRYFILTSKHIIDTIRGPVQIGLARQERSDTILRLNVPRGGVVWKAPDAEHDLVIGDITDSVQGISDAGVRLECLDFSAISCGTRPPDSFSFAEAGIALDKDFIPLGIEPGKTQVEAVCADGGRTELLDGATRAWSSPFKRKSGTLVETENKVRHEAKDEDGNIARSAVIKVRSFFGALERGDSGAPVFAKAADGNDYFLGIVSGVEEWKFHAVGSDAVLDYIKRVYGAGGEAQTAAAKYKSAGKAEYAAEERAKKDFEICVWKSGIAKTVVTLEGTASERNAFLAFFGPKNEAETIDEPGDVRFLAGWDNRKAHDTVPGRKSVSMAIYFDDDGNVVHAELCDGKKAKTSGPAAMFDKECDLMRLASFGEGDTNGKVAIEMFERVVE